MEKLIIIADLGRLRVLELRKRGDDPRERDHLVKHSEFDMDAQPPTRGEVVTDQSGRFGQGGAAGAGGGMSYGEQHNLDSELERKAVERLAKTISGIVAQNRHPAWILAAPKHVLPRLQKALPKKCQDHLAGTVGADLTKEPHAKLEERFVEKS